MNASRNTKLGTLAVSAVALAVTGGAIAATKLNHHSTARVAAKSGLSTGWYVSAKTGGTHADGPPAGGPGFGHGGPGGGDEIDAAVGYLGVTASALQTSLQSGKTLAQIADATSGKSAAGLVDALVAAEKTEIAAAVTAGKLTQAQADTISAGLNARFTDLVNGKLPARGPGGPGDHGGPGHGPGGGDELSVAASYLGLTQASLETAHEAGKTLAQVADATSGKSAAGLIDALVAAEKTEIAAAVTAGQLTQAQADQITANLKARVTDMVNGVRPAHPDGPPPAGSSSSFRSTHI